MKKVLLTMLTLFAASGVWAQVTETDLSTYDDVIYASSIQACPGTSSVKLPICVKSHQNFSAVELYLVLPEGATITQLDGIEQNRRKYTDPKNAGSDVYEYSEKGDNTYQLIGTATCDLGFASGDDVFSYVILDVSELEEGEYPLIVKNFTISGYMDAETGKATGDADFYSADEVTTTLSITNSLVFDENGVLPSFENNAKPTSVTFKRTMKKDAWSTLVLPCSMTQAESREAFGDGVKVAEFANVEVKTDDGGLISQIEFQFTDKATVAIAQAKPLLVKPSKDVTEFTLKGKTLKNQITTVPQSITNDDEEEVFSAVFTGSFEKTVVPENGLFISGDMFYISTGNTNIKGLRGWFTTDGKLGDAFAGAKIGISIDEETTGLNDISLSRVVEGVYDLSGRKIQLEDNDLNKLQKGVYIIDGKKVTIK